MFNQVTYNVLIDRLKAFANGHYKIERFSHGQIDVTDIDKEQRFPWMHVVPVAVQPSSGSRAYQLDVVFADMPRDKENKTEYQRESLSDCIQLAEDLLAEIKNGSVIFGEDVTLDDNAAIQPFMEEYTHVLTGVTLSLTLVFPWNWSACDIPADWAPGGSGSGGSGGGSSSLVLKVNNVNNAVQNILDLVDGTNTTIEDLGDGRVRINASGGIEKVYWGDILGNIADQVDLSLWFNQKADVTSLAEVAFTGDYNDLLNIPTPTTPNLQQVLSAGSTLNQDNTIEGGDFDLTFNNVNDFFVNGNYRGQVGSTTAPTRQYLEWGIDFANIITQDQVTSDYSIVGTSTNSAAITSQSGTNFTQIVCEPNAIKVSTPNIVNSTAQNGMALTLIDETNGKVEFQNISSITEWGSITGNLSDQVDLQNALDAKMSIATYDTDADGVVDAAERIEVVVRNSTGSTLLKGQIVYLSGATGNRPNALLADASTEATSSKTIGFVIADIADNADGTIAVNGTLHDLDTSAFAAGDTLWLSETPGAWQANTPPAEPAHAVFLGYVARSHPNLGRVIIQIQNGYELNELHGVQITSEADKDSLFYEASTGLWKNRQLVATDVSDSTDVGRNLLTLSNPSAVRYLRLNADNSVTALSSSQLRSALGFFTQIQSTQLTNSSTTSSVNITGCAISLEANSVYVGRMTIASGSVPVLGFSLLFTYPNGITALAGRTSSASSTTAQVMQWHTLSSGTPFTPLLGTAQNQVGFAVIELYIATTSNAGTFLPAFRSASTGSAVTIYAGLTNIILQKL